MASVLSEIKGAQFRLSIEGIEVEEYTPGRCADSASYVKMLPKTYFMKIHTSNYNAVRKLHDLAQTLEPFTLYDNNKSKEYLNCYVRSIETDMDTIGDERSKIDCVIEFSAISFLK